MEEITNISLSHCDCPQLGTDFSEALQGDISKYVVGQLLVDGEAKNVHWAVVSKKTGQIALASKDWEFFHLIDEEDSLKPSPDFRILANGGNWIEFGEDDNAADYLLADNFPAIKSKGNRS